MRDQLPETTSKMMVWQAGEKQTRFAKPHEDARNGCPKFGYFVSFRGSLEPNKNQFVIVFALATKRMRRSTGEFANSMVSHTTGRLPSSAR